jgi:hypothetical protein
MLSIKTFKLISVIVCLGVVNAFPTNQDSLAPSEPTPSMNIVAAVNNKDNLSQGQRYAVYIQAKKTIEQAFKDDPQYGIMTDKVIVDILDHGMMEKLGSPEYQATWNVYSRSEKEGYIRTEREEVCRTQ